MYFVLGGTGFVGSAVCRFLEASGESHVTITRTNYNDWMGRSCETFVNCAGNARKFWSNLHPYDDFVASVELAVRSLHDFRYSQYVQISTVDVYEHPEDFHQTAEETPIQPSRLSVYGFHKWLAEIVVQHYARNWLILRLGGLVGQGLKKNPVFDVVNGIPLRLTADSELGFVDVADVARIVRDLVRLGVQNETYNVCGTGSIQMSELARLAERPVIFGPDREKQFYRISNNKLSKLFPLPSSRDAAADFISNWKAGATGVTSDAIRQ